mmetsp:Transcript_37414/g.76403  ORF Transcript_37414/g.76403 Transcript_37414/m.76403 type:complete len:131 (+) Transcript_37414:135-527(+)
MNLYKGIKNYFWGEDKSDGASTSGNSTTSNHSGRQGRRVSKSAKRTVHQGPSQRTQPVLQDAEIPGMGGVQSLDWYARKQMRDDDGCIADAFFVETEDKGMVRKQLKKKSQHSAGVEVLMVDNGNVVLSS